MTSVRLPDELRKKLERFAESNGMTKTEIIKEAIATYLEKHEAGQFPYALGEDLFGQYGSGKGTLSQDYKIMVKDKIHEKMSD